MPPSGETEKPSQGVVPPSPPPVPSSIRRSAVYIAASVLLWQTQGLGMNLISANTYQIQGSLGATLTETNWLIAAYMAPNVSLTILLTKIRTQFGLRPFAEIGIAVYVIASLLHLVVFDLWAALPVRFIAGAAAAPISTLGFLYMLEAFPPAKKTSWGISLALTCSASAPSVARILSPILFDLGQWHQLYTLEIGLALIAFAVVYLLPLTPIPHSKVLHWRDFITYPLIAAGFGLLAVVLSLGRFYWWLEAPWIGVCLAIAVMCIACAAAIELNRDTPLINIQWLTSPEIVHFAITLLVFRIVLSEQTSGAVGMFQMLGLLNDQSRLLYIIILTASVIGGLVCGAVLKVERVSLIHAAALVCIIAGAFMDSHATNLTRPGNMYASQALIAFGGALFLPPAMLLGLSKALKRGPTFLTSFITIFQFTQNLGGLIGSASFGTFVTFREKFHSNHLVEHVTQSNPLIADHIRQLSSAYGRILTDSQFLAAEGVARLAQRMTREANILAYNDAFLAVSVIAFIALAGLIAHAAHEHIRNRLTQPDTVRS